MISFNNRLLFTLIKEKNHQKMNRRGPLILFFLNILYFKNKKIKISLSKNKLRDPFFFNEFPYI